MSNPIVQVLNAGHGTTPACPDAKFSVGDVIKVRRLKHLREIPEIGVIAIIIPPGFPPEYALADANNRPRPLMVSVGHRAVTYIVGFEGDPRPWLLKESVLLPSGEPRSEVKWSEDAK